ncbi:hypothetical protein [Rhodoferax sp.]|uniref:hypothetical protein n=1 Tax=Rhodoferax sp. TaxID=50421 RepID=UPI00271681E5|nr:hypothetical protein [Rhodoferax sp.]MDO9144640.1 hypothetical protein [Rhodoferax sp.]
MSEVIFFQPRADLDAKRNLADFINHCRVNLTLYEDQGGFTVNKWYFKSADRSYAMAFSKYSEKNNPYLINPLDEPFLTFAKAHVRYTQSLGEIKSVGSNMVVLRLLHDALLIIHDQVDILKTDGLVLQKVRELVDLRYSTSDKRYQFGQKLEQLYGFLRDKGFVPTLPVWVNPWRRGKSKAERTDSESRKWQETRCPSLHQMIAIADCFSRATTREDQYWSSVLTFLMFAPSRGGELGSLTIDCLHHADGGALGVRWYGEKGFGDTIKWVPEVMRPTVIEAHDRLLKIGEFARTAAKFAHDNPGIFYRHESCITPPGFPEDHALSALAFAKAMNFSGAKIDLLEAGGAKREDDVRWSVFDNSKWIRQLRTDGNPTYRRLAKFINDKYQGQDWPLMSRVGRPVSEALLLVRDREFHNDFEPYAFSWTLPSVDQINGQLTSRRDVKNPIKSIFQRFEIVDEDGTDIELTSHQLRVWLSTNAERGGMDSWQLAKWAGRARIEDNRHYDLRTQSEREEQLRAIVLFTERPTALEAIKVNLPVSYQDLGLNRFGIADVTEYGMCTHDYAMSPCAKAGECMTCKEHVCIKGMPKTLDAIKRLEERVASQFEKAQADALEGAFGADRWATHLGWKLAHIRTQRQLLESDETPVGAILWIPPEHDPSPIRRALEQKKFKVKPDTVGLIDAPTVIAFMGMTDA